MNRLENYHTVINNLYFYVVTQGFATLDQTWNHIDTCDCFNRLYIVIDGKGEIVHDGKKMYLEPGYAYILPQYENYDLHCDDYLSKIWISFNIGIIKGHDFFYNYNDTSILKIDKDTINKIVETIKNKSISDMIWVHGEILKIISQALLIEEIHTKDILLVNKYKPLFDYIQNNLSFKMEIEIMADVMKLSTNTLIKQFRKDTGMSLKEYIHKQLIHELCKRLIITDDTVREIAYQFGFEDPFYFSRFFKKYRGISPTHYRKGYYA